ncbi:hypothetical protein ACH42_04625 [Endozoicomonas sp. (ex Bugula neritina AB1)]|nr:hypothetical protein ACH42_04625 [Endozoicomonas sp. (ex Bugula neritina AB1)]
MQKKSFHIGGSIEEATQGKVDLQATPIIREAFLLTNKTLVAFVPAVLCYVLVQLVLVGGFVEVKTGNALSQLTELVAGGELTSELMHTLMIGGQFADVLSAPLFLALSLMAVNHSVGLPTRIKQIMGVIPNLMLMSVLVMMFILALQASAATLFFPLGLFMTMALGNTLLLASDKRLPLLKAVQVSVVATVRHLGPITLVYGVIMALFFMSVMSFGIGLIWALPFYFNAKAVIYRTLFGLTLKVASEASETDTPNNAKTVVFDA